MTFWQKFFTFIKKYQIWLLLSLGLILGLIFVFMVPPWMHYDEPGHFEYAWLIANQPGLPVRGDYDQGMRREISASIIEHNLEAYTGMITNPLPIDQPIEIFLPQVEDHPPTYYLLAAIPLRLFRHSDITFQLYLVRLVSLSLFLVLIWVSYRTCRELFDEGHPITWMVPLFLVTLPSFVDIMTAANNDAAANLAFALFVWASVAAIKKGLSGLRLLALVGAVTLCAFTKSTAILAIPLSLLVVLLSLLRGKKGELFMWIGLVVLLVAGVAFLFVWQDSAPAFFYSTNIGTNPKIGKTAIAPVGDNVIVQQGKTGQFYHLLSPQVRNALAGRTVTIGAWIWADVPTTIRFPGIRDDQLPIPILITTRVPTRDRIPFPGLQERQNIQPAAVEFSTETIQLTTTPQFFAFSTTTPDLGGDIGWVYFPSSSDPENQIYWDGIVLVEGDFSGNTQPEYDDADGSSGTWQGSFFNNLIRNASGEAAWPKFPEWISKYLDLSNRNIPSISLLLSIFDTQATSMYYQLTTSRVFRTFWAVFGWATVPMFGQKPYRFFFGLTFFYLIGILLGIIRRTFKSSWHSFLFFGVAVLLQILITLFRGVGSWFWTTYVPVGRYLYPVIVPLGIWLMSGADQLIHILHKTTRSPKIILYGAFVSMQIGIVLWAIGSNILYYR